MTTTTQYVQITNDGRNFWLEGVKDSGLFECVDLAGERRSGIFTYALYHGADALYEVAFETVRPGRKWINRTYREVQ